MEDEFDFPLNVTSRFELNRVTQSEVVQIVLSLSGDKATGIDTIDVRTLKIAGDVHSVSESISIQQSTIPGEWKSAMVTPVFKSGDKNIKSNYRPISVLPILSKVLEKLARNQLITYLNENSLLYQFQSSYLKGFSTITALTCVTNDMLNSMENKEITLITLLDLSKTFDSLDHGTLVDKLQRYGITGTSLKWFINYLVDRTQCVKIGCSRSDFLKVTCGVPQGSLYPYWVLFYLSLTSMKCLTFLSTIGLVEDWTRQICIFTPMINNCIEAASSELNESLNQMESDLMYIING